MNGGLDSLVQQRTSAFREQPQALAQRYQQSQQLLDLLALQKLKSEKEAAARQMQMQMEQRPETIAQQREQEVLGLTKQELAQQVGATSQQEEAKRQQMLQQLTAGGVGSLPVGQQQFASGGIVSFNGVSEDDQLVRNEEEDEDSLLAKYFRAVSYPFRTGWDTFKKAGEYGPNLEEMLTTAGAGLMGEKSPEIPGLFERRPEREEESAEPAPAAQPQMGGPPLRSKGNIAVVGSRPASQPAGGAGGSASASTSSGTAAPDGSESRLGNVRKATESWVTRNLEPGTQDAERKRAQAAAAAAYGLTPEELQVLQTQVDRQKQLMADTQGSERDQQRRRFSDYAAGVMGGGIPGSGSLISSGVAGGRTRQAGMDARLQQRGAMEKELGGLESLIPTANRAARAEAFKASESAGDTAAANERAAVSGGVNLLNAEEQRLMRQEQAAMRLAIEEMKAGAPVDPLDVMDLLRKSVDTRETLAANLTERRDEKLNQLSLIYPDPSSEEYKAAEKTILATYEAERRQLVAMDRQIDALQRQSGLGGQPSRAGEMSTQFLDQLMQGAKVTPR
jgi:hypothetical protein